MRKRPLLLRSHLAGERTGLLRPLLLLVIFVCIGMAYWWHMGNRIAEIADVDLQDPHNSISKEQRKHLRQMRAILRQETGVRVLLRIDGEHLRVPVYDAGVVFLGLGAQHKEAVVVFPPLIQRALGEGPRLTLEDALRRCITGNTSAALCFAEGLNLLRQQLNTAALTPNPQP